MGTEEHRQTNVDARMNSQQHHRFEKLQVQIIPAAAVLAVYFLFWPVIRPNGPLTAVAFVPMGGYGALAAFVAALWVLAGICGVLMVTCRPESAMIAAAFGAGGVSLRSARIRSLLWSRQADVGGLFTELALETAVLLVAAVGAGLIVLIVRKTVSGTYPRWVWKDPLAKLSEKQRKKVKDGQDKPAAYWGDPLLAVVASTCHKIMALLGRRGSVHAGEKADRATAVLRAVGFLIVGMAVGAALLLVLTRSADRGQVLFALVASFLLGSLMAQQTFPTPYGIVAWAMPMLTAVIVYWCAGSVSAAAAASDWTRVPLCGRALPVDWLTAGGGGALLGHWISARIHEQRHLPDEPAKGEQ